MENERTFKLELKENVLLTVLTALGRQPYEVVAGAISTIQAQVNTQIDAEVKPQETK